MKRNLLKNVFFFLCTFLIFVSANVLSVYGQATCDNRWPPNADAGIHSGALTPLKPLHIFGKIDCGDPAIRLSRADEIQEYYYGHLALITEFNINLPENYTEIPTKSVGDILLQAGADANDIILTTRNYQSSIRFATTETEDGDDIERMTILPIGHVGIFETDPKEAFQIGPLWTFHIGANDNFLGYNEFVTAGAQRKRILPGFASCLNFSNNGIVYLGSAGFGADGSEVSYDEAEGGFKGIMLGNFNEKGHIGIGSYLMEHNRLIIRGMGNTDATYALRVMNSQMYTSFIIRDDKRIGIHNNDPKDILHVGSEIVFHDGDSKSIRVNSYYDGAAGYSRNITSVRPSFQIGTAAPGGDNGVYMYIDKKEQAEERLWLNYDQNGIMKGLKILPNGNIGISEVNPSSRLVVFGQGNDAQSSSLEVKNSDNSSLLFVRDDGNVGIGVTNPQQKFVVDGTICAKEARVSLSGAPCWPDFVFDKKYKLMSLEELEKNVYKNRKLPGMPSSEEVIQNGIELGDMQARLLQKIEELTLYVIELKKEINHLKKQ